MTENQKLREALQEAATSLETISRLAGKAVYPNGDSTHMGTFADVRGYATSRACVARQSLALPTAAQVDDINVAESFTSVTKTAAPVGERSDFDGWFADRYQNTEDRQSEFRMTSVRDLMFEAWNIAFGQGCVHGEGQARAALSAGDAVDAQRLDFIEKSARCDPKMDGQHVWWPTSLNKALKGPTLRDAIDAAMRKGQL